jgi:acyl-coenzyme A synthetase/AMP-(fatty) acid ligase
MPGELLAPAYPLLRHHQPDAVIAFRGDRPISAAHFLRDVAAVSAALPARRYVLNLCADRYRFTVGLAAALCREQISLLPPNDTPGVLRDLAEDFAESYCLTDGALPALPIPSLAYPEWLDDAREAPGIPLIPAAQRALLLFTSGSTGRPKPQVLGRAGPQRARRRRAARCRRAGEGDDRRHGAAPAQLRP